MHKILERINENKEKIKLKISKIFTQIRNVINQREDELLLEIDNKFNNLNLDDEFINKNKSLPNKIKKSLEKGKLTNKELNNNKIKFNSIMSDCLDIENNIKNINKIKETIKAFLSKNDIIEFFPDNEKEINEFLDEIKKFGQIKNNIFEDYENKLKFKFKVGKNHIISNNGLMATKIRGGNNWNCTIIGDKEIPKNKISEWKIKITNFQIKKNSWNVLIGIGPNKPDNVSVYHINCWSFICGANCLSLRSEFQTKYNNHGSKCLKAGDIIKVIVDRKLGNLSFEINDENYGIACSNIPKDDVLYPIVMINDQEQTVEIV